jgi:hypothetical protein
LLVGAKANSAMILLTNNTQGFVMFYFPTAPSKTVLAGNCAEWILENLGELAKYTTVKFTNCAAVTVKAKTLYPDKGNTINMVDSHGTVISKGKDVGKREVDVSYV